MNKNKKNNVISIFFTLLVIGMLVLSGPVSAIEVSLDTPDIDYLVDDKIPFTIIIQVNDGEFLPILYTDLTFDYGSGSLTCRITGDNTNCDFLTVDSIGITNLNGNYGYGYGYGYGYEAPNNYGYGYDFGYGYGYGYGDRGIMTGAGSGTITYTLIVDVSEIPVEFLNKLINVEAKVYGGTDNNYNYFTETSSFNVVAQTITPVTPTPSGGGGGGGTSPTGNVYDDVLVLPTPEEPIEGEEETPPVEELILPIIPPEEETGPGGLAGITGAVVGAIGSTTGIAILTILAAILSTFSFSYFVSKRKKKKK